MTEGNCVHIQCDPGYDYDDMFGGKADPCCVFDVVVGHLVFEQVHCVLRIAYCILRIAGALGPSIVSLNTKNLLSPPPPPAYCVLRIAYCVFDVVAGHFVLEQCIKIHSILVFGVGAGLLLMDQTLY